MADTLLFRGGSSSSIDVSTVQSREIVIDTDTDQIVSGTSKKKTVMEDSNGDVTISGDVKIGGTLPADPNITLNASNGSAELANGKFKIESTGAQKIIGTGFGNAGMFHLQNDGVWRAIITGSGRLTLGGNAASPGTANITLDGEDGSAEFAGVVTASNITAFKSNLKTSIQNATDLDAVKTAIIDALNNHL